MIIDNITTFFEVNRGSLFLKSWTKLPIAGGL